MTKHIDVLDHGFVELVDHMGSDQSIVDSARVSVAGDEVKASSSNRNLIRYLYRNQHSTPLESVVFTFAIKAPIFVARQWMRHRTATYNEMSARYGVLPEEFYIPERFNLQAKDNHQGSSKMELEGYDREEAEEEMLLQAEDSFSSYQKLLDLGLTRELARSVLPVNVYTKFYFTMNLRNLFHFIALREDSHAQYEIRVYADALFSIIKDICPLASEAYIDYSRGSVTFSAKEISTLQELLYESLDTGMLTFKDVKEAYAIESRIGSKREVTEFLRKLGITDDKST